MKTPPSDDDLRQRLQELGRREATTAPRLDRVLRGRGPASEGMPVVRIADWRRPAVALASVFLIAAVAWWWPMRPEGGGPVVGQVARSSNDPVEEWGLPTDGLLTETWEGAGSRDVERLSREIEGLLQP